MTGFKFIAIKVAFACIMVFIIQQIFPSIVSIFSLSSQKVNYEPWRIITHIFVHADIRHLFNNIFALSLFGSVAEKMAGNRRFIQILLFSLLITSSVSMFYYNDVIGISGIAYATIGYIAMRKPDMIIPAFGIPLYASVAAVIWLLMDMAGIFYPANIAYLSHISGFITGMLFGFHDREWTLKNRDKRKDEIISDEELERWEEKYMINNRK